MKRLLMMAMAALLLTACGDTEESKPVDKKPAEEKPVEQKVTLSETKVSFTNFTVELEKAEVKDGQLILKTRYKNDSYDGEKSFMASAIVEAKQNDEVLEETTGAASDKNNNYFYKNKVGNDAPVEFKYKLLNDTDVVEVSLVPTDWNEEAKSVTISIK